MARMILRVCRMAKIYPIRLKTFTDPNGNITIHADYAAHKATSGTLLFCSTPDKGKFTEADYPSAPFPDKFFRIGAANSDVQDQLRSKSSKLIQEKEIRDQTGSSVVTALGGGLAAMILYCIMASILGIKIANHDWDTIVAIPTERLKFTKEFIEFGIKLANSAK
ncbi:hypothetical protein FBEOM_12438 [Fusarium beomiforme]|uniref:Uncharacterized protein n=1 Tax=Fusarium beomiforme TaxID=44412 RepID=A0A9P5DPQ6_9HYPO|nr:hypothetical protein FBEOM_12438 [Fusarium beomiforme]